MKKAKLIILATALSAGLLAGCNPGGDNTGGNTDGPSIVEKAEPTVTISITEGMEIVYGSAVNPTITVPQGVQYSVKYMKGTEDLGSTAPSNVGQYKLIVTTQENNSHKSVAKEVNFKIIKATPVISVYMDGEDAEDGLYFEVEEIPNFTSESNVVGAAIEEYFTKEGARVDNVEEPGNYVYHAVIEGTNNYNNAEKTVAFEVIGPRTEINSVSCTFSGVTYTENSTTVVEVLTTATPETLFSFESDPTVAAEDIEWWYTVSGSNEHLTEWPDEPMTGLTFYYRVKETKTHKGTLPQSISFDVVTKIRETVSKVDATIKGVTLEDAHVRDSSGKTKKLNAKTEPLSFEVDEELAPAFVTTPEGAAEEIEWSLWQYDSAEDDFTIDCEKKIPDTRDVVKEFKVRFEIKDSENYRDLKSCSFNFFAKAGADERTPITSFKLKIGEKTSSEFYPGSSSLAFNDATTPITSLDGLEFITDPEGAAAEVEWDIYMDSSAGEGNYDSPCNQQIPDTGGIPVETRLYVSIKNSETYRDFAPGKGFKLWIQGGESDKTVTSIVSVKISDDLNQLITPASPFKGSSVGQAKNLDVVVTTNPSDIDSSLVHWGLFKEEACTTSLGQELPNTGGADAKAYIKVWIEEDDTYLGTQLIGSFHYAVGGVEKASITSLKLKIGEKTSSEFMPGTSSLAFNDKNTPITSLDGLEFITNPAGAASEIDWDIYLYDNAAGDYTSKCNKEIPNTNGKATETRLKVSIKNSDTYYDFTPSKAFKVWIQGGEVSAKTQVTLTSFIIGTEADGFTTIGGTADTKGIDESKVLINLDVSFVTNPEAAGSLITWYIGGHSSAGDADVNYGHTLPDTHGVARRFKFYYSLAETDEYEEIKMKNVSFTASSGVAE